MQYTLIIHRFDRRTKSGYRPVGTYQFDRRDAAATDREVAELRALYPADQFRISYNPTYTRVKSLMSGQEVEIRTEDRGTCSDPSTERYWSM